VGEYRKQEQMAKQMAEQMAEVEQMAEDEPLEEGEESLTQEIMSLNAGDIADIATILTDGVVYRTNDGPKQLNGDKIRKLFVKQLRELLRDNGDF